MKNLNILFICTANQERSPTAEHVFKDVPGWNVKSAGTRSYITNAVTPQLLEWADKVIVMEDHHLEKVLTLDPNVAGKVHVLGIDDIYSKYSASIIGLLINRMAMISSLDGWVQDKFHINPRDA